MYSNSELAKRFADGKTTGKANSMFIEGRAIFSYGFHFPIALRLSNGNYLFNTDKYSVSTSKHQSNVLSKLPYGRVYYCDTKEIKNAVDNPNEPIIIEKFNDYDDVNDCLDNIKRIYRKKGLKYAPIFKIKKLLDDWELVKSI